MKKVAAYRFPPPMILPRQSQMCLSLLLPFEPKMNSNGECESRVRKWLLEIEQEWMSKYPAKEVLPVWKRLRALLNQLNYDTYHKTVALLVSESTEKIFYLDCPLKEQVVYGQEFSLKDLTRQQVDDKKWLVLLLESCQIQLYSGRENYVPQLVLRMANETHRLRSAPGDSAADASRSSRLEELDRDLGLLLQSNEQPLFVLGDSYLVRQFTRITNNENYIAGTWSLSALEQTWPDIRAKIEPELHGWEALRQEMLRKSVRLARENGTWVKDPHRIRAEMARRNVKTLLLQDSENLPDKLRCWSLLSPGRTCKYYLHDNVDSLIEQALDAGGSVKWAGGWLLEEGGPVALITRF